jgi:FkbM family methyltransferase
VPSAPYGLMTDKSAPAKRTLVPDHRVAVEVNRVSASGNTKLLAKIEATLGAWKEYTSTRSNLPPGRLERIPAIARQLLLGRYHRFAHGVGSALRDLRRAAPAPVRQMRATQPQLLAHAQTEPAPTTRRVPFAQAETTLFSRLKEFGYSPTVVYDIGAAGGSWSNRISRVFTQASFHLFEPLAFSAERYRERLPTVLKAHPNFHLHPIALSSANGKQEMQVFHDPVGSTLLDVSAGPLLRRRLQVECWRLDDFVSRRQLAPPNVLKIDVQGFELKILQGAVRTLATAEVLLLETWLYQDYGPQTPLLEDVIAFLSRLDFLLTDFGDSYIGEHHRLCSVDAFFMSARFLDKIESSSSRWDW